ncbi:citrate transporter [bacterium]|nr:citrate transporter [bacterium]
MKLNLVDRLFVLLCGAAVLLMIPQLFHGAQGTAPAILGIRFEFILFGLTLLGVALYHHRTLAVALTGLASITIYKLTVIGFDIVLHVQHEASILINLFGLLLGFAILAKHFEESHIPDLLPSWLPSGWVGGFVLLWLVWIMSAFLDNIAAAMIGGTIALVVFKKKVHIGYLAAIVAASNAGGAGSVVGDTTTTMMWIDGVSAFDVMPAFFPAAVALMAFGVFASKQQFGYQPIVPSDTTGIKINWIKILVVAMILAGAISTNVLLDFPAAGVWIAIVTGALFCKTEWREVNHAIKGTVFLLSLVLCASMMPVDELPPASWQSAFALGFISSIFDNIPLTKLALQQGGYDWGVLAYTVGFGGSMVWFGSSAGVAISNIFPEAKSVGLWLKHGWHIIIAYVIGFFAMLWIMGWEPHEHHKPTDANKEHSQLIMQK